MMNGNKKGENMGAATGSDGLTMNNHEQNNSNINRDINQNERGRKNLSNQFYMKMNGIGAEAHGRR
jgi:hypothetical protein